MLGINAPLLIPFAEPQCLRALVVVQHECTRPLHAHLTTATTSATPTMSTQHTTRTPGPNRLSTVPTSASKSRQLSHLHAQLAQLTAHMSDLENLLRMTSVQAEGMRGLGGYAGGM